MNKRISKWSKGKYWTSRIRDIGMRKRKYIYIFGIRSIPSFRVANGNDCVCLCVHRTENKTEEAKQDERWGKTKRKFMNYKVYMDDSNFLYKSMVMLYGRIAIMDHVIFSFSSVTCPHLLSMQHGLVQSLVMCSNRSIWNCANTVFLMLPIRPIYNGYTYLL